GHPNQMEFVALRLLAWILAALVISKMWFTTSSWNKISPRRTGQYLLIWLGATLCFVSLAILSRPPFDAYRRRNLYLLAALLLFPFARLGMAPSFLANNRHR